IHFPMPNQQERYSLWCKLKPCKAEYAGDVDLPAISGKYELSGSSILNILHYASLHSIHKHSQVIEKEVILEGIKREYEKEERVCTI
ncbi:MAG TPA: hypothetical protein VNS32_08895, partial [Flavisolibacter sp.]|nr:hypothetical protein [Flavisolibacter sp.]